ncbi:MAG TPA: LysR family transcriptional regulator [Candidatus Nitrosotenuis sp.]|jgi:DNA-binding transcriptional LysR family regulator|nr:LysR family transcriptional regulator [Candidatus Nitrosotenuis sp.]
MDLGKLKIFYTVVEEGSISQAAKRLNISQPALSRTISNFEYQMKAQLFERTAKGMHLTPQGEKIYVFTKKIIQETESFQREFYEDLEEVQGDFKIIATPFVGVEWLIPHLKPFLKKYSRLSIKIYLQEDNINPMLADAAICTPLLNQPHLIQKELFRVQIGLYASESYLEAFGEPQSIEELNHHHLIAYRSDYLTSMRSTKWLLNLGRHKNDPEREAYLEVNSIRGMINGALSGLGIAELPNYSCIINSGLKPILRDIKGPEYIINYTFAKARQSSKKIKLLYEYLAQLPR